ncbi:hypothetical protein [Cryobacterium sp. Hb1]|uniref:hypothetical protein n=1 Tax=Cryobacterium sp. Hb1 TaxID=1259147 RepID=UPI00106CA094|nr:hypothetical protein [Cryobacterium sp. Hb1]TFD68556.1 hypothetical protein E3T38_09335 [Cryobacterium sp. Hb1]
MNRSRSTGKILAGALCAVSLGLAGCVSTPATPNATESAEPVPVPTITPVPVPAARTADSPLASVDAYALCRA